MKRILRKRRQGAIAHRDQNEPFIDLHPIPTPSSKLVYYDPYTLRTRVPNEDYAQRQTTLPVAMQLSIVQNGDEISPMAPSTHAYERTFTTPESTIAHCDSVCHYCGDVTNSYPVLPPDVTSRSPRRVVKGDMTPRVMRHIIDDL